MTKIIKYLFIFLPVLNVFSQTTITIDKVNDAFIVPCKVNGVRMNFIFDTGATDVTLSLTEAEFLLKQGLLKNEDIKETVKYKVASGEINEGTKVNLKEIEISGLKLYNIDATIVHEQNAPLLLGMSALSHLGKIEIVDNKLIINDFRFTNTSEINDINYETKKTIEWINYIFVKHQYESKNGIRPKQIIHGVEEINGITYILGRRIQETKNRYANFNRPFLIPIDEINNINFNEKEYNYWLRINTKNYEKNIIEQNRNREAEYTDKIEFILNKSIDEQKTRPKLVGAFEYLIKLHGKNLNSNKKVFKKKVEGGYVEHIGEILEDGHIKNSYDEQERIVVKQETYIDQNDKIKELKLKTTFYYPKSGQIKLIKINPGYLLKNQYIGEYKFYYENGNPKVEGEFYDFFKNGFKVYFGNIRVGTWKWYFEDGGIDLEENYKVNIEYWENGTPRKIFGLYLDTNNTWIKHGAYYEFNKNNSVPNIIREYEYGELIKEKK